RRHQETLWGEVRSKVFHRLERIANIGISAARTAFRVEVPNNLWRVPTDFSVMRKEMLVLALTTLIPAKPGIEAMNREDWRIFIMNLQNMMQEIDRIIT